MLEKIDGKVQQRRLSSKILKSMPSHKIGTYKWYCNAAPLPPAQKGLPVLSYSYIFFVLIKGLGHQMNIFL